MAHRSLKVNVAATVPLFTTAQAKQHLKIDTTADDTYIDNLITAATESCQIYTNRYFITTTVTQYSDSWKEVASLYKSPVQELTHIKYYNSSDVLTTWEATEYILDEVSEPARIAVAVDYSFPNLSTRELNRVEVKYKVGYGDAASDVPDGIKQAVLLCIGNWYENRQSVITGRTATELPLSSQYLLNQYKVQTC